MNTIIPYHDAYQEHSKTISQNNRHSLEQDVTLVYKSIIFPIMLQICSIVPYYAPLCSQLLLV